MNRKYILLPLLCFALVGCTASPSNTTSDLTGTTTSGTTDLTTSLTTGEETEHLIMQADFTSAQSNAAFTGIIEGWTLDISPNSYAGAIKMQYSGNSIITAEYSFHGPIRIEIDWYTTINGQVVTTDPFMFNFYGLNAAKEVVEVEQKNNVMLLPNPGYAEHQKDTIILLNTSSLIRSIKFELTTKLASSNVGILTIEVYSY